MSESGDHPVLFITGGAGFVGRAILRELAKDNPVLTPREIRIFDRQPLRMETVFSHLPITVIEGDVRNARHLAESSRGADIVLHLAALIDWGTHPAKEVFDINLEGTRNVIAACTENRIATLVSTSSLDAIFPGCDLLDADETTPYPQPFTGPYAESKAAAEQLVQAADGDSLATAVIRPSGIWGEADPYHLANLAQMAKSGLFVKIGSAKTRCMNIYVGNVAHGQLLLAKALRDGNPAVRGQLYFLVDCPGANFFDFLSPAIEEAGLRIRPKNLRIPGWALYPFALLAEGAAFLLRPVHRFHPPLSRFALSYICSDFTLKGDRAVRDFQYAPAYTVDEARRRTGAWFRENGF